MFITRHALYKRIMRHAEAQWKPVFEIHRQNATLLRIYSNQALRIFRRGPRRSPARPR